MAAWILNGMVNLDGLSLKFPKCVLRVFFSSVAEIKRMKRYAIDVGQVREGAAAQNLRNLCMKYLLIYGLWNDYIRFIYSLFESGFCVVPQMPHRQ